MNASSLHSDSPLCQHSTGTILSRHSCQSATYVTVIDTADKKSPLSPFQKGVDEKVEVKWKDSLTRLKREKTKEEG